MQVVSTVEPAYIIGIQRLESRAQGIPFGQQARVAKQYLSGLFYRFKTGEHLGLGQKDRRIQSQPWIAAPPVAVTLLTDITLNQKPG